MSLEQIASISHSMHMLHVPGSFPSSLVRFRAELARELDFQLSLTEKCRFSAFGTVFKLRE